ncbi:MAG: hypothetical protein ABW252_21280 [Polyangiales bacterium]
MSPRPPISSPRALLRAGVSVALTCMVGCATQASRSAATPAVPASAALKVPSAPRIAPLPRVRVATGLANPRGMHALPDGSLLISTAGTGDPAQPNTGGLLRLTDANGDGDFDDDGERTTLLSEQPSANVLEIVRRDEVFGMAGMAEGEGTVLVALAFFGGPSKVFRVGDAGQVTQWSSTIGNLNDLTFDPRSRAWYAVASTTDEVVRLHEGKGAERVVKIPPLASGQDSVPAYLQNDPYAGGLLVSLFSGSPEGEEGGKGVELVPRAASVVRVLPDRRSVEPVVTELTVPTDLVATEDGMLYVLEFCDSFVDPVESRAALAAGPSHGGFRRFSGRLLRVDRKAGDVAVIAEGLDHPTNLLLSGGALYVAQGMGTPGRQIPGPDGQPRVLTGFVERIALK